MRRTLLVMAGFLAVLPLWGQEPKPAASGLMIPRPAGIDDETWNRVRTLHAKRVEEFIKVLAEAEKGRIRPERDSLKEFMEKRETLNGLIDQHHQEALAKLIEAERWLTNNYVFIWSEVSPRLSGKVQRAGKGSNKAEEPTAIQALHPGDALFLEEGHYCFTQPGELKDVLILGRGADKTKLVFRERNSISKAERVRFEGLHIDCGDDEWLNLRDEGAVHVKDCFIFNYNSGAGGSNAIFAVDTIMLVEGCTFEGMTGRAAGTHGGNAFDLRGMNLLSVRKTTFIDNSEILRAGFPCTFDECRSVRKKAEEGGDHGIMPYGGGTIWLRKNAATIRNRDNSVELFDHAADDLAFIELVLGERRELDDLSRRMAQECQLARHLPYWIRLLGHVNEKVRSRAAKQFEALTGQTLARPAPAKAPAPTADELRRWSAELDSNDFDTRQAAKDKLEKAGAAARPALEAVAKGTGTLEQRTRASELLAYLDGQALKARIERDIEFARWIKWYEENRDRLQWDEKGKRYVQGGK